MQSDAQNVLSFRVMFPRRKASEDEEVKKLATTLFHNRTPMVPTQPRQDAPPTSSYLALARQYRA